ncbi:MAG: hypothetical protein Q7T01_00370 [bacterium]|nr:hypothetical protein [bacterium]
MAKKGAIVAECTHVCTCRCHTGDTTVRHNNGSCCFGQPCALCGQHIRGWMEHQRECHHGNTISHASRTYLA